MGCQSHSGLSAELQPQTSDGCNFVLPSRNPTKETCPPPQNPSHAMSRHPRPEQSKFADVELALIYTYCLKASAHV